jgi:hypothetical protein
MLKVHSNPERYHRTPVAYNIIESAHSAVNRRAALLSIALGEMLSLRCCQLL